VARTVPAVNWVFKEHPASRYYPTEDVDLQTVFERVESNHIGFIGSEADFNSRSIVSLAAAIVTCIGTAGLEYATQGIPCVLAGGRASYSGFGFTIEPQSVEAYQTCLQNIGELSALNEEQIRRAKLLAYFSFCVYLDAQNNYFCPYFDSGEIKEWSSAIDRRLWKGAADQFRSVQHVNKMRAQVQEMTNFINDPSWTQYFDTSELPYVRTTGYTKTEHNEAKTTQEPTIRH